MGHVLGARHGRDAQQQRCQFRVGRGRDRGQRRPGGLRRVAQSGQIAGRQCPPIGQRRGQGTLEPLRGQGEKPLRLPGGERPEHLLEPAVRQGPWSRVQGKRLGRGQFHGLQVAGGSEDQLEWHDGSEIQGGARGAVPCERLRRATLYWALPRYCSRMAGTLSGVTEP